MVETKPSDYYNNWKAIDIYLFDNGQSYSPPRKYHLLADQLEWWPVTLNYLANAQYGLIDQSIDLFTLGGQKIKTPLELINETAYVAVKPLEPFIEADYEKYLIRASKSWEKRQSLREHSNHIANAQNSRIPVTSPVTAKIQKRTSDIKVFQINSIQTPEESLLIQTILANKSVEKLNFVAVKSTRNTDKETNQNNVPILPTIKNNGDKRSSIQQIQGNKSPLPLLQPVSVKKPSFKRRESIRLSNAKITPPPNIGKKNTELVKYSGSRSESLTEGNLPNKSRIYKSINNRRNSVQPVLSKVDEVINELKKYPNEKDPCAKNSIPLNKTENITNDVKNGDFTEKRNLSGIYVDVTTLKQFQNDLNLEKTKETSKSIRDSFNKIMINETVNESKQRKSKEIIQTKEQQIQSRDITTETSVNNAIDEIGNELKQDSIQVKKEKNRSRETVTSNNNASDTVNVITENMTHVNLEDNPKPISLMFTENAQNVLKRADILPLTDNYINLQDSLSKPNSQITSGKLIDVVLTSEKNLQSSLSKPDSRITFRESVNNGSREAHKPDLDLIKDKFLSVQNNIAKLSSQNIISKSVEDVLSSDNKNKDNPEPTSEITIKKFVDEKFPENVSSAVCRSEVEALNTNYLNVQASTLALASEITNVNFTDKASSTDAVKILSVNDGNENVRDNFSKYGNEGNNRFSEKVSASVGREDVLNLKLSIDIWNHNSTINSKPTVVSMSHSPFISKQNESQGNISDKSNVIHKPNTWNATNKDDLTDDQKIVIIKYVSHYPKDEKENSNENPKSNGDNKDLITIILPVLKLDHITECCNHCKEERNNDEEYSQNARQQRISSIKYPIRRTTSCISLLNSLTRFENKEAMRADGSVKQFKDPSTIYKGTTPSREISGVYKDVNTSRLSGFIYKDTSPLKDRSSINKDRIYDNRESHYRRKSVAIYEEFTIKKPSYNPSRISENTNKDQLMVFYDKESKMLQKTADNAIQTDWCNLVMEARRQENGHYSLFLPSIEMLKQYKLLAN